MKPSRRDERKDNKRRRKAVTMAADEEGKLDDTSNMHKRKVNKRRKVVTTPEHVTAPLDFAPEWLFIVLGMPEDELTKLLGDIANHGKITTAAIKKARTGLPSFPALKWTDVAEQFGFPYSLEENIFDEFVTPSYSLPPSVHEIMFEAAWRIQDVYRERLKRRLEVARVRILDPYLVRIIGLFQGRVIDRAEQEYATESTVEHEIFMIGGILFMVAEYKFYMSLEDNVAQLFTEILAAAKATEGMDFANLRIYGLITDLIDFHFYSYNPISKKFAFDATMTVTVTRNCMAFTDMIPVCNKIFGVILTAYIDGLEAITLIEMKTQGDVLSPGPAPLQQLQRPEPGPSQSHGRERGRKSTDCWEVALELARECRDKFNEPADTVDDIERNSTAALELLAKSVRSIRRVEDLTGKEDPSSMEEIKDLARREIHKKYLDMMHNQIYYY